MQADAPQELLEPVACVSNAGKSATKEPLRSRLSTCTALGSPHSPAAALSPWSTDTPSPAQAAALSSPSALPSSPHAAAARLSSVALDRPACAADAPAGPSAGACAATAAAAQMAAASSPKRLSVITTLRDDRTGLLNSPTGHSMVASLPAAEAALGKLLAPGRPPRSSLLAAAAPAAAGGVAGTSLAGAATGAAVGRLSLAHVGLLAAPDATLLPGSPLAEAAAAAVAEGADAAPGRPPARLQPNRAQATPAAATNRQVAADKAANAAAAAMVAAAAASSDSLMPVNHTAARSPFAARPPAQPAAAAASSPGSRSCERSSLVAAKSSAGPCQGSAAFRCTSREKAGRAGRVTLSGADLPGPGHYPCQHGHTDRHVPAARLSPPSSRRRPGSPTERAARPPGQQQQQQQETEEAGHMLAARVTATAPPAASLTVLNTAAALRCSATDVTPRTADADGPAGLLQLQGQRLHPRAPPQQGTAPFKSVSREQLARQQAAAAGGGRAAGDGPAARGVAAGGLSYFRPGYDHLVRPSSRGPVANFAKQTPRPPVAALTDCPAALGPGAYHRQAAAAAAMRGPDFGRTSGRPGSCPSAVCGQAAASHDWPGLWGWAAAEGCVHQTGHLADETGGDPRALGNSACTGGDGLAVSELQTSHDVQPSSRDALAFARQQRPAELVLEHQASNQRSSQRPASTAAASCSPSQPVKQQQQQQPWHSQQLQQLLRASVAPAARQRPATARAVPSRHADTLFSLLAQAGAPHRQHQQRDGMLGLQELQRFSSSGFSSRVKGGAFPNGSRAAAAKGLRIMSANGVVPPASVAVLQPGTELAYEPNPSALKQRSPSWQLPPNRVGASRKWAQLAAQAALQP